MTACVNEQKKKVGGGVLQSKVLHAVMALVLALGLMPVTAGTAFAAEGNWSLAINPSSIVANGSDQTVSANLTYSQSGEPRQPRTFVVQKDGADYDEGTVSDWVSEEANAWTLSFSFTVKEPGEYTVTVQTDYDNAAHSWKTIQGTLTVSSNTATDADRFSAGSIAAVYDHDGYLITAGEDGAYPLSGGALTRVDVTPFQSEDAVTAASVQYATTVISGSAEASTYQYGSAVPASAGTYYAKAEGPQGGAVYFKVAVAQKSLDGIYAYDEDMNDRTFNFNFADQKDGVKWAIGSVDVTESVEVAWYKDGKKLGSDDEVRDAGTYVAQVKGKGGTEYANAIAYVEVVMNKLDLASVAFTAPDKPYENGEVISVSEPVSDIANFNGTGIVDWKLTGPTTSGLVVNKGTYTWTGTVNADDDGAAQNLTGTATVTFDVRGTVVGADAFQYENPENSDSAYAQVNADDFMTSEKPLAFDRSSSDADKQGFNPAKFRVVKDADNGTCYEQGEDYTLSYEKKNADGSWSAVADVTASGSYRVTATMSADKDLAGKATAYFTVTNGAVGAANYFVTYKGDTVDSGLIEATYDGTDVIEDIDVVVKKGDTTLVQGVDYTVEYTLDGKAVDSVVDADDYVLTIKPVTYDGPTATVSVVVSPVTITGVRAYVGKFQGLLYTGSAITPKIEYQTADNTFQVPGKDGTQIANPDYKSSILPADLYDVRDIKYTAEGAEKAESVDAIVEPGAYEFQVVLFGDSKNIKFDASVDSNVMVNVLGKLDGFEDVLSTDWFVGPVNTVANAQWMNGIAGTNLFAPNADITRADVVCVLYNMADGDQSGRYPADSAFSDVPGRTYFTAPVNWAAKTEIVNGYGDGTFAPYSNITREEFASMLANYAKAYGVWEAPTADVSGMPGGDGVSDWALENVEWAVENHIMGNNGADLDAQGKISRAEVAAMVSNYAEAFGLLK